MKSKENESLGIWRYA